MPLCVITFVLIQVTTVMLALLTEEKTTNALLLFLQEFVILNGSCADEA